MALRAVFSCLLLAWLGGCRDDVVELEIKVPAGVAYDHIRVVKSVDGVPAGEISRATMPPDQAVSTTHFAGLFVPSGARNIGVLVQALADDQVMAQESRNLVAPVVLQHASFSLRTCVPPFPVSGQGTCTGPQAPGPEPSPELPPERPDAGSDWRPPVLSCDVPDPAAAPPLPPRPADSPDCQEYCDLVGKSCHELYATRELCLHTCGKLAWPRDGAPAGDTLTCRRQWAVVAAQPTNETDRMRFCANASVDSTPRCGDACSLYCRTGTIVCGSTFPPPEACLVACRRRDDERRAQGGIYTLGLQCRFDWLRKAVADARYCELAAPDGPTCPGGCQALNFTY